jgi:hypothetical protein
MKAGVDPTQKSFEATVVGCFYYHGVFGRYVGEPLKLVREPKNTHDVNAIAVLSTDGQILGHLSRSTAAWFARELDSGTAASVTILKVIPGSGGASSGRQSKTPPQLYVRISRIPPNQMLGNLRSNSRNGEQNQNAGKTKISGPCFVVTAALGSETDPMVCFFRFWRDNTLSTIRGGELLIRIYSILGPVGALIIKKSPCLRYPTRWGLFLIFRLMYRFYEQK